MYDDILKLLVNLALHYPQVNRSPEELQVLALDWCEDLEPYPVPMIANACKAHRRSSAYFPCVSEIIARCDEMLKEQQRQERLRSHALTPSPAVDYEFQKRQVEDVFSRLREKWSLSGSRTVAQ